VAGPAARQVSVSETAVAAEPAMDYLDIPAFLRRQAD
jgi:3-deoxy-D-manno-octulosonic acid (KDO) 8-phosphate synthase